MRIIVGLGNPGEKYKNNRHNVGWLLLDKILPDAKWTENKRFKALTYQENDCLFVKPLTFMNNSGESVRAVLEYYKLIPKNWGIINKKDSDLSSVLEVIHDDVDLLFTKTKITKDSSSAGHNGIKSLISHLKTQKFTRIRIGIKNETLRNPIPTDKFVLQNFGKDEKEALDSLFLEIKKEVLN